MNLKVSLPNENRKLYKNILISLSISIVITLFICSTLLVMNFESIALKLVSKSDLNSLKQTSREVAKMTDTAKTLSFQIYRDPTISKLIYFPKPDIYDITLAMQQLDNYRLSMPFIESIYVYNANSAQFYISSDTFRNGSQTKAELDDQGILDVFDHIDKFRPYIPIPRTYRIGESKRVSSYSYLSYDDLEKVLSAAIVVNISETWVNKDFGGPNTGSTGKTFIMNQQGTLLSRNGDEPILTDYASKAYIKTIQNNHSDSNYFVDTVDGVKSLISYTAPDSLGWRYVRTTPYADITREITKMRTKTIWFSLGILAAGLLGSLIASRKLYGPNDKVLHRLRALETERRNSLHIWKQDFLRNVLLGRESFSPETLQERLTYFGSPLLIDRQCQLVLFKMDCYLECVDKYRDDVKLVKYAIMNICAEIGTPSFLTEAIDMGDDSVVLLLSAPDPDCSTDSDSTLEKLQAMQAAIAKHLKLSVSITISPVQPSVMSSILLYKQAKEASLHRLFYGHGCILYAEHIMSLKSKEYAFPVHREKQLVDCMMSGRADEAKQIYSDMVRATAEYPYTVVQLTLSHLAFTVITVLNTIRKNNALELDTDFDSTLASLNEVEILEEITVEFYRIFEELSRKLEEKRSMKQEDLIKKINEIIDRDYANPNLCLNSIADELDMSPIYISRLYKQLTLYTLTDVIQEVRMNKSKQLLLQSDYSVADIAMKTGFTNSSYFYRMFKKCNGVTPNVFRKGTP